MTQSAKEVLWAALVARAEALHNGAVAGQRRARARDAARLATLAHEVATLYRGDIVHRGVVHSGQHPPIIDADLFEAVQRKLAAGAPPQTGRRARGVDAPLLGKLFDAAGRPMTRAHAAKGDVRYHYYLSTAASSRAAPETRTRVSAPLLEKIIVDGRGKSGLFREIRTSARKATTDWWVYKDSNLGPAD